MKASVLVLAVPFLLIAFCIHGRGLEDQQDQATFRELTIPERDFTLARLEARFRKLIHTEGTDHRLLRVEVFTDLNAISGTFKYTTDVSYEAWKDSYLRYAKTIPNSAELLMVGRNAAMRMRDARGVIKSLVLQGSDPYTVLDEGVDFHLLHLAASRSAPVTKNKWNQQSYVLTLSFFLVAKGTVDQKAAEEVSERLRSTTGVEQAFVEIRGDPWFIRDEAFPIVSPYIDSGEPPTKQEYEHSRQWSCVVNSEGTQCRNSAAEAVF